MDWHLVAAIVFVLISAAATEFYHHRWHDLREEVRRVCTQKLDGLCWMDLYDLAAAADVPMPDLTMLPREIMLHNCTLYVDCLKRCPGNRAEALRQYHSAGRQASHQLRKR